VLASALEDKRQDYAFPSMAIEQRPSLIEKLEASVYDITTLRFTIRQLDDSTATQTDALE